MFFSRPVLYLKTKLLFLYFIIRLLLITLRVLYSLLKMKRLFRGKVCYKNRVKGYII
nr:MAG TPA: hypothetical protein [Caudoviricetes sp.]